LFEIKACENFNHRTTGIHWGISRIKICPRFAWTPHPSGGSPVWA